MPATPSFFITGKTGHLKGEMTNVCQNYYLH